MATKFPLPHHQQVQYNRAVTARGQRKRRILIALSESEGHGGKYLKSKSGVLKTGFRLRDSTLWFEFTSGHIYSATGYSLLEWQHAVDQTHPMILWTRHIRKATEGTTAVTWETSFANDCDFVWTNPSV